MEEGDRICLLDLYSSRAWNKKRRELSLGPMLCKPRRDARDHENVLIPAARGGKGCKSNIRGMLVKANWKKYPLLKQGMEVLCGLASGRGRWGKGAGKCIHHSVR